MKIKNYIWVALALGFAGVPSAAQRVSSQQGLSAPQRAAAVNTSIGSTCSERAPKVPRALAHDPQVFSSDRIERTLTGVWHGRVKGEYDKKFLGKDGNVNVDYYMIVDSKRGEALVFEQFGPKRSAPQPKAGTPTWSYVFCNRANYKPRHPPQVHTFYKVSDNVEDGRAILRASTGLALAEPGELVLANVWQQLVDTKYFDDPARSLAFAGGFFKPFKIGNVPAETGSGSLYSMDMEAEYRGSGMTAARFQRGVPLRGYERGKFLGVATNSGDYLVSSFALGEEMTTAKAEQEGVISLKYDKIVIGPLAPNTPPETSRASAVSADRQK